MQAAYPYCTTPTSPSPTDLNFFVFFYQNQIKSSLYSPYYAEACNELRGPSPRLSAWATQLRRNVATVASRWRHCANLTGPGIEPQTSRTDSVRFATELTAGCIFLLWPKILTRKKSFSIHPQNCYTFISFTSCICPNFLLTFNTLKAFFFLK